MLTRLPGRFAAGAVNENLVSLLDLMPTMLELSRVDYPGQPDLAGNSFLVPKAVGWCKSERIRWLKSGVEPVSGFPFVDTDGNTITGWPMVGRNCTTSKTIRKS